MECGDGFLYRKPVLGGHLNAVAPAANGDEVSDSRGPWKQECDRKAGLFLEDSGVNDEVVGVLHFRRKAKSAPCMWGVAAQVKGQWVASPHALKKQLP